MTLIEILQNADIAQILANFLEKKLQGNWAVQAEEGEKVVWVATMHRGDGLNFRIECQRLGKTFEVETTYRAATGTEKLKDMQGVLAHLLEVKSDPTAWELDNLPRTDE